MVFCSSPCFGGIGYLMLPAFMIFLKAEHLNAQGSKLISLKFSEWIQHQLVQTPQNVELKEKLHWLFFFFFLKHLFPLEGIRLSINESILTVTNWSTLLFFSKCKFWASRAKENVDRSNFVAALAHYLLFTQFTPSWEVNRILRLKFEAVLIMVFF